MAHEMTRKELIDKRYRNSWSLRRETIDSLWRELAASFLPHRFVDEADQINQRHRRGANQHEGDLRLDEVGTFSLRTFSSFMMSGLTSPSWPWRRMEIATKDEAIKAPGGESAQWVSDADAYMSQVLSSSTLYQSLPQFYSDYACFGMACYLFEEDEEDEVFFAVLPPGTYWVELDQRQQVHRIGHTSWMSIANAAEKYGADALSREARDKLGTDKDVDPFEIRRVIEPNKDDLYPEISRDTFPWRSLTWEATGKDAKAEDNDIWLEQGGHVFKPFSVSRWDTLPGQPYAVDSAGKLALPPFRQLTHWIIKQAKQVEMELDPATTGPGDLPPKEVTNRPGAHIPTSGLGRRSGVTRITDVRPQVDRIELKLESLRLAVKRSFFADLATLMNESFEAGGPAVTATQIAAMNSERLGILGPQLQRLFDMLEEVTEFTYGTLLRSGSFEENVGPMPAALANAQASIDIEFVSTLAQALAHIQFVTTERSLQFMGGLAQLNPQVLDKIDWDEVADNGLQLLGFNPRNIRDDKTIEQIRAARAAQVQQQQQMEAQAMAAQTSKDASQAEMSDGSNVLDQLQQGGGRLT